MTFKVKAAMCPTCIFRPGNPMHLEPGRVKGMVEECRQEDSYIVCHDTLGGRQRDEAMCRGYLDTGAYPQMLRIAERLNMKEEV